MKVFELMSELSKLPAGFDVKVHFSHEAKYEIRKRFSDPEPLESLIPNVCVCRVSEPDYEEPDCVKLLCEVMS